MRQLCQAYRFPSLQALPTIERIDWKTRSISPKPPPSWVMGGQEEADAQNPRKICNGCGRQQLAALHRFVESGLQYAIVCPVNTLQGLIAGTPRAAMSWRSRDSGSTHAVRLQADCSKVETAEILQLRQQPPVECCSSLRPRRFDRPTASVAKISISSSMSRRLLPKWWWMFARVVPIRSAMSPKLKPSYPLTT